MRRCQVCAICGPSGRGLCTLRPVSESMVVDSRWQLPPCEIPTRPRDWGNGVRVMRTLLKSEEGQRRRRERRYKRYEHPQVDPPKTTALDA
eukprot:66530-Pleurochrysis_carterae.AAC.4